MHPCKRFCRPLRNYSAKAPLNGTRYYSVLWMYMAYAYFAKNGEILPISQAVVPLGDIHYAYGFGVYETIRVSGGTPRYLDEHCRRLMDSAAIIGLEHGFDASAVARAAKDLIAKNQVDTCNLKVLLLGGATAEAASLNILCLNPRYPDRKLYKEGAHAISVKLERPYPHAKTLNMLPSYLAHRQAQAAGAYDALLVNRHGHVTEGTASNFFALQGQTIFTPPESEILSGVTRHHVLQVALQNGFIVQEKDLPLAQLQHYDNLFLTSTSAKIMPIRSVDDQQWDNVGEALRDLMQQFDNSL